MNTTNNTSNSASAESDAKLEKLTRFLNWPCWSSLTKAMLIEKDVWSIVSIGPRQVREPNLLWDFQVKEDRMVVGTAI